MPPVTRRRYIGITAAAAGLNLLPFGYRAKAQDVVTWKGVALGAVASMQIHHPDRAIAERLHVLHAGEPRQQIDWRPVGTRHDLQQPAPKRRLQP